MARKKMQFGTCHLCKKNTELSFEHIPPKVAFNSQTRYRSLPLIDVVQKSNDPNYKPTSKIFQGGIGEYCLCKKCNSFLGNKYVPSYYIMALVGQHILVNYKASSVEFRTHTLSPLKLLKQVISMFICINSPGFTEANPELLEFVKNPDEQFLPDKFKIYMYLNNEGATRYSSMVFHSKIGLVSEIAFPPLGFLLSINNANPISLLSDITHFKNYESSYVGEVNFALNILKTHIGYLSGDYRSQEEIDETVRQNEEFMKQNKNL